MFTDRDLYRVEFGAGLKFYKLTGPDAVRNGAIQRSSVGKISPWWFAYDAFALPASPPLFVPGIPEALMQAQRASAAFSQFQRSRGAVNHAWKNPMSHLLVVQLARPVVGLIGRAAGQHFDAIHGNVRFIGGAIQFYLPELGPGDLRLVAHGEA
jgi:hypothetical protein